MPEYRAIAFRSDPDGAEVVLFAAPADQIDSWAGVPQRELLDHQETIGFQREENPRRLQQLSKFFSDPANVSQNPLLCAQRSEDAAKFLADTGSEGPVRTGTVIIKSPDLSQQPLTKLFEALDEQLRRGSRF